jgi:hypothetical protein
VITLDASASYDIDGNVAAYHWDFDADGVVDWVSSEAVPEASSDGTVVDITPGASGVVTATYNKGYAEWFYPTVHVTDDRDADSAQAIAKLGLSGWQVTILNERLDNYLISVYPKLIDEDPGTGRLVMVGAGTIPEIHGEHRGGLFYLEQEVDGTWTEEEVEVPYFTGSINDHVSLRSMFWDENLEPVIIFHTNYPIFTWYAQRKPNGSWLVKQLYISSLEGYTSLNLTFPASTGEPGRAAALVLERLSDTGGLFSETDHTKYHIAFYDHGEWTFVDTGYDTADDNAQVFGSLGNSPDEFWAYFRVIGDMSGGPWEARLEEGVGLVDPVRIDDGSLFFASPHTHCKAAIRGADGSRITFWDQEQDLSNIHQYWLLVDSDDDLTVYDLDELTRDNPDSLVYVNNNIYESNGKLSFFCAIVNDEDVRLVHWRLEAGSWLVEETSTGIPEAPYKGPRDLVVRPNGEPVFITGSSGEGVSEDFDNVELLMERLDPRIVE